VYGNPEYVPITEDHPLNPTSPYGVSKLAGEEYCQVYRRLYGMDIVMLRFFTAYGPRQRPDMAIRRFVEKISKGEPPVVYGDGNQQRDFTYIDDVLHGTVAAAQIGGCAGEVFNLGGGYRTSINNLLDRLLRHMGKSNAIQPIYEGKKLGDVETTHADISKARDKLGYQPRTSLDEGLKNFVEWYKTI
jgi:UDP-glucose 4-epimerase